MNDIDPGKFEDVESGNQALRVHYHEMGPSDGTPVVFVQTGGAATSAWMCWYQTLAVFAAAGYHVFAPDAVGQGDTVQRRGEGLSGRDFLLALMDALHIPAAHLIGNSGGTMAMTPFAVAHPDRVLSLIFSGGEP